MVLNVFDRVLYVLLPSKEVKNAHFRSKNGNRISLNFTKLCLKDKRAAAEEGRMNGMFVRGLILENNVMSTYTRHTPISMRSEPVQSDLPFGPN